MCTPALPLYTPAPAHCCHTEAVAGRTADCEVGTGTAAADDERLCAGPYHRARQYGMAPVQLVCTWLVLRVPRQYISTQTGLLGQAEMADGVDLRCT